MNQATAGVEVSNTVQIEFSTTYFTLNTLSCATGTMLEVSDLPWFAGDFPVCLFLCTVTILQVRP